MITTEYDGCGKCLVAVRRLSRKTDATNSPERQLDQVLGAVEAHGGHVIAWADDWEVSGATDPLTRAGLGPWLRGEAGPYSGIAGAAVDRIGRNQRDVLNTAYMIHESGRSLITYGHAGPWDLDDANDEMRLSMEAFGAQMELRAIQKRNRDETLRARRAGQPHQKNSYGFQFVRLVPTGQVDHVDIDPVAALIIRDVAERILADETDTVTCSTESARLTRAGVLSPADHRAVMYGRSPKGSPWRAKTLKGILTSEAALGFLMHGERAVLGADGHPIRLAPPLWDRATRDALIAKTAPRRTNNVSRAPKSVNLLSGLAFCGNCGQRLYVTGRTGGHMAYACTGRVRGIPASSGCKPAPTSSIPLANAYVGGWFIAQYGSQQVMRREYDPGTGYTARILEFEANRKRLRDDRAAGLYDSDDDAEWFRTRYAQMGREIDELRKLPERPAGMRSVPTGKSVEDLWNSAPDDAARREILTEFEVRATLFPRAAKHRIRVTGINPEQRAADGKAAAEHAEEAALAELEEVDTTD
ncbi:recombinase family protein [Streptomyces sp. SID13588]|uniref:recombinase family protein n=1 Tax=Streptomyces sp. SID13588 TaxID=2706051 RepID=UPI0013C8C8B4|nr:recombinase family protein [Streptomyces sp. SID13588]NEA74791.1 recombinase family protein [Streptomyces sp. SID13588]